MRGGKNQMMCKVYKQTSESNSTGLKKDACLECGRTLDAHTPQPPAVHIFFVGKLWKFKNWEEAKSHGFYLY